jgi:hypothetical protein
MKTRKKAARNGKASNPRLLRRALPNLFNTVVAPCSWAWCYRASGAATRPPRGPTAVVRRRGPHPWPLLQGRLARPRHGSGLAR